MRLISNTGKNKKSRSKSQKMKNFLRFAVVVLCVFTITISLNARWIETNGSLGVVTGLFSPNSLSKELKRSTSFYSVPTIAGSLGIARIPVCSRTYVEWKS
jgi:hypothetical protein